MIRNWKISNFKAIPARVANPLDMQLLNILVGPNSSGKSTLLQSILLITQTLRNPSGERPLILNGEMVKLGHASEVIHEGDEDQPICISFSILPNGHNAEQTNIRAYEPIFVNFELNLPSENHLGFNLSRASISMGENVGIVAESIPSKSVYSEIHEHPDWYIDSILRSKIKRKWFDYILLRNSSGIIKSDSSVALPEKSKSNVSFFHFLPNTVLNFYDRDDEIIISTQRYVANYLMEKDAVPIQDRVIVPKLKGRLGNLIVNSIQDSLQKVILSYHSSNISGSDQIIRSLMNDIQAVDDIHEWINSALMRLTSPTKRRISQQLNLDAANLETKSRSKTARQAGNLGIRENSLPSEISSQVQQVITFFAERVKYLGPLRDDPRAIYGIPINPETKDVGVKGEFTAAVLERYKEEVIDYPLPPLSNSPLGTTRTRGLMVAIGDWLRYMDLVEEVTTNDLGKIGYELKVRSQGVDKELDLTNVGVGVSQILPTLVSALLAPQDSLILLEQPELHLHPKVQSRLGDFILCIALSGKQCIVETHSEYLVNRIRRRIAEAEERTILDNVSLYFVERGINGATFNKIVPNEYGAILSWPKGFFDEGPSEAELIMNAAMRKRQAAKITK